MKMVEYCLEEMGRARSKFSFLGQLESLFPLLTEESVIIVVEQPLLGSTEDTDRLALSLGVRVMHEGPHRSILIVQRPVTRKIFLIVPSRIHTVVIFVLPLHITSLSG